MVVATSGSSGGGSASFAQKWQINVATPKAPHEFDAVANTDPPPRFQTGALAGCKILVVVEDEPLIALSLSMA